MYSRTRQISDIATIEHLYKGKFNLLSIGDVLLEKYEIRNINAYEMTIDVEYLKKNSRDELIRTGERHTIQF